MRIKEGIVISDYGIRIKNFQAASIYEYQLGVRDQIDSTNAMLTNSLFKDFLMENGLNVYKEKSTRDIICLEFEYGTKSYKEIKSQLISWIEKENAKENPRSSLIESWKSKIDILDEKVDAIKKITKNDLRIMYYKNGVDITYRTHNKCGKIIAEETIHYKMLYRTPGKAKKGTCMFIREELYDVAHNFLYMGIKLPEHNSPIVEVGAYSSLITSSIVGKVEIKPEQILIVNDLSTSCCTDVIKILTDKNKHCYTEKCSNYKLSNEVFDGQALIDSSIFPEWGDGFVLLRHHFTKCAAFNSNIELFMRDYFGDKYDTAIVKDMFGRDVKVSDIKLITTNNAIKWLKFGVTFDYWADWIRMNGCQFGIVKTAHPSKLGDVQRMSYQMTNSLNINKMRPVVEKSVEYINKLKTDNDFFLEYLTKEANFSNDYEVLVALCDHNPDFINSKYFRDRKKKIIETYVLNFKSGRSIQNADNLTIVGSPYAMLLHSVGEDAMQDPTFKIEDGTIQCWTGRFEDGEYVAEFRNPFNSRNNLGYLHNVHHEYFDKYFNLGKLCIAVNLICTDFQDRNNGSDQDSDSIYTTNQPDIVKHAKYCYENYPTIVNKIQPEKNIYDYSLENYAKIDNDLMAAQLAIGQSSNLAQLSLTYTYNFDDEKYYDYVCILSVIAQCAIDNAKRKYDVDLPSEIDRINSDLNIEYNGLPKFWLITKKDKRKARTEKQRYERQKKNKEKIRKRLNEELICPMNYLYDMNFNKYRNSSPTIPTEQFIISHLQDVDRRKSKKVEELIEKYSLNLYNFYVDHDGINWNEDDDELIMRDDFNKLIKDIKSTYISGNYLGLMSWLINRAFLVGAGAKSKKDVMNSVLSKNKSLLIKVLYTINPDLFLQCFCTTI